MKVALVAGALGVVGRALMERLDGLPEWRAVGLSRESVEGMPTPSELAADLELMIG